MTDLWDIFKRITLYHETNIKKSKDSEELIDYNS